jgi:hypothetical protein
MLQIGGGGAFFFSNTSCALLLKSEKYVDCWLLQLLLNIHCVTENGHLTNSMEKSLSGEDDAHSSGKDIPRP